MSESARFLLATLCGVIIAAMVHIAIVLGMPRMAENDAFQRLRYGMSTDRAQLIAAPGSETWLPQPDPATAIAACPFDLANGPVRVSVRTGPTFQSVSLHARAAGVFFAVTDRAAVRGALDLVIVTRRQMDEILAGEDDDEPSRDVRIVAPARQGFVVVRVLAPFPSLREQAEEAARAVSCAAEPL